MVQILDDMEELYDVIYGYRSDIASLNRSKIEKRSQAWSDASNIKLAKEKEDFVRSEVADIQEQIDFAEAEIEKAYGKLKVAELRLEYSNE